MVPPGFFRNRPMPPRRKSAKDAKQEIDPSALRVGRSRSTPRFRMMRYPDGSERAVRCARPGEGARMQAMADWLGDGPGLSSRANMRSMESLLSEVVESLRLEEQALAPEVLAAAWLRAVGPFLSTQAELLSVAKGTARIRTGHPAVRYELNRLKAQIVRVLNAELGEGSVRRVSIVHG